MVWIGKWPNVWAYRDGKGINMVHMLQPILAGLAVFIIANLCFNLLFPKARGGKDHTRNALRQIMEETQNLDRQQEEHREIVKLSIDDSRALQAVAAMPGGLDLASLILKAGYGQSAAKVVMVMAGLLIALPIGASMIHFGQLQPVAYIAAIAFAVLIPIKYLKGRIRKRNDKFINMFPDVLDMIVRSVRSGFPLNTAIKMVADNMDPPVSTEFRQVADEIALGRSLDEALSRLAQRIDEPDIHFFVVVLNVQNETGGNLAEIISNLSGIIRKRKHLRMKIRSMTSEGRATGWVLGALPIVEFLILSIMAPEHLEPLFNTQAGFIILAIATGLILLAFWIVRQMIDIDI